MPLPPVGPRGNGVPMFQLSSIRRPVSTDPFGISAAGISRPGGVAYLRPPAGATKSFLGLRAIPTAGGHSALTIIPAFRDEPALPASPKVSFIACSDGTTRPGLLLRDQLLVQYPPVFHDDIGQDTSLVILSHTAHDHTTAEDEKRRESLRVAAIRLTVSPDNQSHSAESVAPRPG